MGRLLFACGLAMTVAAHPARADFFDDVRRTFQTDIPRTFEQDIPRAFGAGPKARPPERAAAPQQPAPARAAPTSRWPAQSRPAG